MSIASPHSGKTDGRTLVLEPVRVVGVVDDRGREEPLPPAGGVLSPSTSLDILVPDLERDLERGSSSGSGRTLDASHMMTAYVIPVDTPITAHANNGCEGPT